MTPSQKLSKNVEDLGKLIVAKGFRSCPKSNKSPNLVTLVVIWVRVSLGFEVKGPIAFGSIIFIYSLKR